MGQLGHAEGILISVNIVELLQYHNISKIPTYLFEVDQRPHLTLKHI